MSMPAILSLLLGLALAQRFSVFVLIPVVFLILTFALAGALAHVDAASISALTAIVVIVGLQLGYFLGIGVRHGTERAHRRSAASLRRLPPPWRAH